MTDSHPDEQMLTMFYYGETGEARKIRIHLKGCEDCRARFEALESFLNGLEVPEVPEPDAYFETRIWAQVRDQLDQKPAPQRWWQSLMLHHLFYAAAAVMIAVTATWLAVRQPPADAKGTVPLSHSNALLLAEVQGHLERAKLFLLDYSNSDQAVVTEPSPYQEELAQVLLQDNRFFRLAAQQRGEHRIGLLLEDLERTLVEISNRQAGEGFDEVLPELQGGDSELLFKLKMMKENLEPGSDKALESPESLLEPHGGNRR